MRQAWWLLLGFCAVVLAACGGGGPEIITAEFEGRDCSLYVVDEDWLVYEWSPPVSESRPLHLVARNLATGVETEIESDWWGRAIDIDRGVLVYDARKRYAPESDLVAVDLATQTRTSIYRGLVSGAQISGNTVVWGARNEADQRVIAIGSSSGGGHRLIEDADRPPSAADTQPRISGTNVVFHRMNLADRKPVLMHHDLESGTTRALPIVWPTTSGFDVYGETLVYTKTTDGEICKMNLANPVEEVVIDVSRRVDGPIVYDDRLVWIGHVSEEEFKPIAGQPLIDERDFRTLFVLNLDTGKYRRLSELQYGLRRPRISNDRKLYFLKPRVFSPGSSEITDIARY